MFATSEGKIFSSFEKNKKVYFLEYWSGETNFFRPDLFNKKGILLAAASNTICWLQGEKKTEAQHVQHFS